MRFPCDVMALVVLAVQCS